MTVAETIIVPRRRVDFVGIGYAVSLSIIIIFPLIVVGTWAFTEVWRYPNVVPQQFGLRFWNQTLSRADVWSALWLSLQLSTVVTLVSAPVPAVAGSATEMVQRPGQSVSVGPTSASRRTTSGAGQLVRMVNEPALI